jgi:membrane associated rhomboid family serine protease
MKVKVADGRGHKLVRLFWRIVLDVKLLFLTFMMIFVISGAIYVLSSTYPMLNDILKASPTTPWGIVTSLFVHEGLEHLAFNMAGLFAFFFLFSVTQLHLSKQEVEKRVSLFLIAMFLMAIFSNILWTTLVPQASTAGSSGLVFASEGIFMGFTLLNGLQIMDLFKDEWRGRKRLMAIYLCNLAIFGVLFVQIVFAPQVFLNVAPAVNAFVHGVSFLGSFFLTFFWSLYRTLRSKGRLKPSS